MRFVFLIVITALNLAGTYVRPSFAVDGFEVCDQSYDAGFDDLMNLPWNPIGARSDGRGVLYVIGAPWCPYCKRTYNLASSGTLPIEFRFAGMDPFNAKDFERIADGVKNGSEGISRTYSGQAPKKLTNIEVNYLAEGSVFSAEALRMRFQPQIADLNSKNGVPHKASWGSPVLVGIFGNYYVPWAGIPKIELLPNEIKPHGGLPAARRELIRSIPKFGPASNKTVPLNQISREVYAFPDRNSNRMCASSDITLNVVGETIIDGVLWLKAEVYQVSNGKSGQWRPVHGYIPIK